jgi:DNA-binding NarL/FixJ family response regulator
MPKTVSKAFPVELPDIWRRKHLTKAEQRVVELTACGLSTKEVAAQLGKSTLTARNQLTSAMRKLDVSSRFELIARLRPVAKRESDEQEYSI